MWILNTATPYCLSVDSESVPREASLPMASEHLRDPVSWTQNSQPAIWDSFYSTRTVCMASFGKNSVLSPSLEAQGLQWPSNSKWDTIESMGWWWSQMFPFSDVYHGAESNTDSPGTCFLGFQEALSACASDPEQNWEMSLGEKWSMHYWLIHSAEEDIPSFFCLL